MQVEVDMRATGRAMALARAKQTAYFCRRPSLRGSPSQTLSTWQLQLISPICCSAVHPQDAWPSGMWQGEIQLCQGAGLLSTACTVWLFAALLGLKPGPGACRMASAGLLCSLTATQGLGHAAWPPETKCGA